MVLIIKRDTVNTITGSIVTQTIPLDRSKGSKLVFASVGTANVSRGPILVGCSIGDTNYSFQVSPPAVWVRQDADGISTSIFYWDLRGVPTEVINASPFLGVRASNNTGTNAALSVSIGVDIP